MDAGSGSDVTLLASTYSGLRVVDLATNIAGPFAAMILGDMGADVIKVERAPNGDDTRSLPPFVNGQATVFLAVNRNKRSIMLDYKAEADRAILARLIESADVVIESFPPGVAQRLELTWGDVSRINPAIILASVSAFGDGPIGKAMPGYDALVQAVSGLMSFTGNPGEPTVRMAPSVLDLTTGNWTAMGIMAALVRRGSSGVGEHVTAALIDTAFNLMNHQLLAYQATGEEPQKLGSGAPSAAPYAVYKVADGEVLIATATEDQFPRLCSALGLGAIVGDPRFQTIAERIQHRTALDQIIAEAVAGWTVAETLDVLDDSRISSGRVNSVAEACALPVVHERGLLKAPIDGCAVPQVRLPVEADHAWHSRVPPKLDEHRSELLAELDLGTQS
jgi:crotonobetainyl-CoA:carnitine CoA-transferase CaiB-like acyl-CoA transferase